MMRLCNHEMKTSAYLDFLAVFLARAVQQATHKVIIPELAYGCSLALCLEPTNEIVRNPASIQHAVSSQVRVK